MKALTEGLALELAADQILVNAIAPGTDPGAAEHVEGRKRRPSSRARRSGDGAVKRRSRRR